MKTNVDLTGKRFGRLSVVEYLGVNKHKKRMWLCRCDCGGSTKTTTSALLSGKTKNCSCLRRENCAASVRARSITHGMRNTKEYHAWCAMKQRCYNPKNENFKNYGGRGITVCESWRNSFEAFYADMGKCPKGYSIERMDVNGNYEPANCYWASLLTQANNKRRTVIVEYNGVKHPLKIWAAVLDMPYSVLRDRIQKYKWDVAKAFETPVRERKM